MSRTEQGVAVESMVCGEDFEHVVNWPPGAAVGNWRSRGLRVQLDWAGRPALSVEDAARAYAQVVAETDANHAAYLRDQVEAQERERVRVADERSFFDKVYNALARKGRGGGEAHAGAMAALRKRRERQGTEVLGDDDLVAQAAAEVQRPVRAS